MDCAKVGQLILQLRREKGLTQRQLADTLGISNKTVSKWECGRGAPDVSLWRELSSVLGADLLRLLQGELAPNRPDALLCLSPLRQHPHQHGKGVHFLLRPGSGAAGGCPGDRRAQAGS